MEKEDKKAKIKEKAKNIALWAISIFFISAFIMYFKEIPIPSIGILIAGIMLLPPVSKEIKKKLQEKDHKYTIIKNILILTLFAIFMANLPSNNTSTQQVNANTIENTSIMQSTTSINEINTNEILNEAKIDAITEKSGTYTGDVKNGKKEGNGTFKWNDGTVYEGEWKNDQINGKGKLTIPDKDTYEGYFENGQKEGQGKYTFANGDIYEGNFSKDKISGQGKYTFKNGDTYSGEFLENQFNGQGTYTMNGKTYTGTWKNNEYKK